MVRRRAAAGLPISSRKERRRIIWISALIGLIGALGLGAAIIFGASEPRLDATSDETWAASYEKVRAGLPVGERAKFDAALQWISVQGENVQDLLASLHSPDATLRRFRERAHGLTASEVIARANTGSVPRGDSPELTEPQPGIGAGTQTIGRRSVTIENIARGPLSFRDMWGAARQTDDEFTIVALTVRNLSATQKISYRSWGYDGVGSERVPTLTDDLGNTYRRRDSGSFSDRIVGAVAIMSEMYPSTEVRDIIAFERPVDAATTLFLDLPAWNVDEEGAFRFKVQVTTIVKR